MADMKTAVSDKQISVAMKQGKKHVNNQTGITRVALGMFKMCGRTGLPIIGQQPFGKL